MDPIIKETDFNKLLHYSRPQVVEHSSAKVLQIFQVGFPIHSTAPLTLVTTRENREGTSVQVLS